MYPIYSILLALAFAVMLPLFLIRRAKYASGFRQRLGNFPDFKPDGRRVIWIHCVSVGETNAARPLVDALIERFPGSRIIISTTTRTGQELAQRIFAEHADPIIYFPFDFKFSARRALETYKPALVLLMETEIWPRFIREAKLSGAKIAMVNGRLSARSVRRYSMLRPFVSKALQNFDLALMQGQADADRIIELGMPAERTIVTGNLKFDVSTTAAESDVTEYLAARFALDRKVPLIVAASTHEPEELWVLNAWCSARNDLGPSRLMIVPRHPERFDRVAKLIEEFRDDPECEWRDFSSVRRSKPESEGDKNADIILLDSIGELRGAYPLADIVFVGGSLIPHGGQSVFEPAAAGKAIITGPYTANFDAVVKEMIASDAIRQLPTVPQDFQNPERLYEEFSRLLTGEQERSLLGTNAKAAMEAGQGAARRTAEHLAKIAREAEIV